ncbi:MAG TPA: GGDEF domain-containing protein [Alphaproteobacteria bacterium]|nr:GGDEF domain-containing protein [Alphaproteobacteria bacterium]
MTIDATADFQTLRALLADAATEIARLQAENKKLRKEAVTDPLTGLPNRNGMDAITNVMLKDADREDRFLGVITLDIDHFKKVNTDLGHEGGDDVLVAMSNIIKSAVRNADVVGRMGGEEFVVLAKVNSIYDLAAVAEKIRLAAKNATITAKNMEGQPVELQVTLSSGASIIMEPTPTLAKNSGYVAADITMMGAKVKGRNRACLHGPTTKYSIELSEISKLDAA